MDAYLVLLGRRNVLPVLAFLKHLEAAAVGPACICVARSQDSSKEWLAIQQRAQAGLQDSLELDAIDANKITETVRRWAHGYDGVYLHYTGGTMAMAIHAMAALGDKLRGRSYLAADTRQILSDTGELCSDARRLLSFPPAEIVGLHGYHNVKSSQGITEEQTKASVQVLREFLTDASFADEIRRLRKSYGTEPNPAARKCFASGDPISPDPDLHAQLLGSFGDNALRCLVRYDFLEYAVFGFCRQHCGGAVHSMRVDFRPRDAEIDVVFQLGYEMWCVSCTTDSSLELCYHKGAEVLYHARNFGGDGARAVLICLANQTKKDELERLLARNLGTTSPIVRVWGRAEVERLENTIRELFKHEEILP
jgi:hypothetical protein